LCRITNNLNGLRISHDPPPVPPELAQGQDTQNILSNLFGPLGAEQLYYPHSDDHNTQNILKKIQRGVVIVVKPNGDIYATRLCQARVYYANSPTEQPKVLPRSEETLMYSFQNEFLPMLQNYQMCMSQAPSCECYFSLGQSWSDKEPLSEMLIHFSVTHFLAKKIFRDIKAQKPLQIEESNTNSLDIIQNQLQQMALSGNQ